jgi:hypothetical protein
VVVIAAPVLHDFAARLAGRDPSDWRTDSMRWAYELREAVSIARPAWIVSHYDAQFEADAIGELAAQPDAVWDVDVASDGPFAPGITLVRTLAQLDLGPVAASITGPLQIARLLASRWDAAPVLDELQEACGDVVAALIAAYAEAGAGEILVWEPEAAHQPDRAAAAHGSMVRRAALAGARVSLAGTAPLEGYARAMGHGLALIAATAADDIEAWQAAAESAGADAVVLTDGPVPGDVTAEALLMLAREQTHD